jgi:hypothetical protein
MTPDESLRPTMRRVDPQPAYPVSLAPGVTPRMAPEDVASLVLARLGSGASIDRMILLGDASDVATVELRGGSMSKPAFGPVWVVRAHGSFVSRRGGPNRVHPIQHSTGYYVIADRDGTIWGMGMP